MPVEDVMTLIQQAEIARQHLVATRREFEAAYDAKLVAERTLREATKRLAQAEDAAYSMATRAADAMNRYFQVD